MIKLNIESMLMMGGEAPIATGDASATAFDPTSPSEFTQMLEALLSNATGGSSEGELTGTLNQEERALLLSRMLNLIGSGAVAAGGSTCGTEMALGTSATSVATLLEALAALQPIVAEDAALRLAGEQQVTPVAAGGQDPATEDQDDDDGEMSLEDLLVSAATAWIVPQSPLNISASASDGVVEVPEGSLSATSAQPVALSQASEPGSQAVAQMSATPLPTRAPSDLVGMDPKLAEALSSLPAAEAPVLQTQAQASVVENQRQAESNVEGLLAAVRPSEPGKGDTPTLRLSDTAARNERTPTQNVGDTAGAAQRPVTTVPATSASDTMVVVSEEVPSAATSESKTLRAAPGAEPTATTAPRTAAPAETSRPVEPTAATRSDTPVTRYGVASHGDSVQPDAGTSTVPNPAVPMPDGAASTLSAEATTGLPAAVRDIPALNQIVQGVGVIVRKGETQVRLHLYPESLGQVLVHVTLASGDISVHMVTDTAAAGAVIQDHLTELRTAFASQGLQVDGLSVTVGSDSSSFNASAQHQRNWSPAPAYSPDFPLVDEQTAAPVQQTLQRTGSRLHLVDCQV